MYAPVIGLVEKPPQDIVEKRNAAAKATKRSFRDEVDRAGLEGKWLVEEGPAAQLIAEHAAYADLTIVEQSETDQIAETVLMGSGRPVLIVPYVGNFTSVGRRVVIAWKRSREAARAVNDALPILKQADDIKVLTIGPPAGRDDDKKSAMRLTDHLARHGVKASVEQLIFTDIPDATVLLNYVSDDGADLIVAGGYSHSRARELAFGGVTRTLLQEMIAPVLLSH
jgi:nucleotide-binding universal stress UspA family protein